MEKLSACWKRLPTAENKNVQQFQDSLLACFTRFAARRPIISTALSALCTTLIFQFYATFYYGFGWFPSTLIVLALSAAVTVPFWFFRVARFMTYCTLADTCSRIPRLLASSFIIALLVSGPIYRATVMMESSSASMQFAQAAIKEATKDATDQFHKALKRGVRGALESWNDNIEWFHEGTRSVVQGRGSIEDAVRQMNSKVREAFDDCYERFDDARRKCDEVLFVSTTGICSILNDGFCEVLSPVMNTLSGVDLSFLNFLEEFDEMLDVFVVSKTITDQKVDSDGMKALYDQIGASSTQLKDLFSQVTDVITYVTTAILVLTPLRNWLFLRGKKPAKRSQTTLGGILLIANMVLVTSGVVLAYMLDFSVSHSYNTFAESVQTTSIELRTDNSFEMQVSGGKVGKAIADLLMKAVKVDFEMNKAIGVTQCFPASGDTVTLIEVLKVVGALVFLLVAVLVDPFVSLVKVDLKLVFKNEESSGGEGSAGYHGGGERSKMEMPKATVKPKIVGDQHEENPRKVPQVALKTVTTDYLPNLSNMFKKAPPAAEAQPDNVGAAGASSSARAVFMNELQGKLDLQPVVLPKVASAGPNRMKNNEKSLIRKPVDRHHKPVLQELQTKLKPRN